jgi:hypothetical protein
MDGPAYFYCTFSRPQHGRAVPRQFVKHSRHVQYSTYPLAERGQILTAASELEESGRLEKDTLDICCDFQVDEDVNISSSSLAHCCPRVDLFGPPPQMALHPCRAGRERPV